MSIFQELSSQDARLGNDKQKQEYYNQLYNHLSRGVDPNCLNPVGKRLRKDSPSDAMMQPMNVYIPDKRMKLKSNDKKATNMV